MTLIDTNDRSVAHDQPSKDAMVALLAKAFNFRDLGGIKSEDGREVRRGMLYRSAALSELASEHLAAIRALNIRSIIDFRYNSERALHPTPWQEMGCSNYWSRDYEPVGGHAGLDDLLTSEKLTNANARELMVRIYPALTYDNGDSFKRLFRSILSGHRPVLFHCTSGKDRTGIAAALVLSALGVPRPAILADYLATRRFEILASPAFRRDKPLSPDLIEIIRPIFGVDADYLDAMFASIAERHGSIEHYFRDTLELSEDDLHVLRERLLA